MKTKFKSDILTKLMYERKLEKYEKEHDVYYSLASVFPKIKNDKYELQLLNKIKVYEKLIKNLSI